MRAMGAVLIGLQGPAVKVCGVRSHRRSDCDSMHTGLFGAICLCQCAIPQNLQAPRIDVNQLSFEGTIMAAYMFI